MVLGQNIRNFGSGMKRINNDFASWKCNLLLLKFLKKLKFKKVFKSIIYLSLKLKPYVVIKRFSLKLKFTWHIIRYLFSWQMIILCILMYLVKNIMIVTYRKRRKSPGWDITSLIN